MTIRVLGYVMARNEWPLLGLAITHGFHCGLDHIVVVDHASTDETHSELKHLQARWPRRLTVIRLELDQFLQEQTTRVVMSFVGANEYDWVYVFDADEFALTSGYVTLVDLLMTVTPEVDALRYELLPWVSPYDMNDLDLTQYSRIRKRAIPCIFLDQPATIISEQIQNGHINFFDLPFPSKVIVRGKYAHKLNSGAHQISDAPSNIIEQKLQTETLCVGHICLLSRRRIKLKSAQGKFLIDANFPPSHGWQCQMIYHLDVAGQLEFFWRNHSTQASANPNTFPFALNTVTDDALYIILAKAVKGLMINDKLNQIPSHDYCQSTNQFKLDNLVKLFNEFHMVSNQYKKQVDLLSTELELLSTQYKNQFDVLSTELQLVNSQNKNQVDVLLSVLSSNSWRLTKPLRYLLTKARSLRSSLARGRP